VRELRVWPSIDSSAWHCRKGIGQKLSPSVSSSTCPPRQQAVHTPIQLRTWCSRRAPGVWSMRSCLVVALGTARLVASPVARSTQHEARTKRPRFCRQVCHRAGPIRANIMHRGVHAAREEALFCKANMSQICKKNGKMSRRSRFISSDPRACL